MTDSNLSGMKLFCGSSHPKLGEEIAGYLNIECAKIKISRFSCGEIYARVLETTRGIDTFVLQTGSSNVNEDIMELFIIIDALKRASAKSINVIIPHYAYARQDKKSAPREPISARLIADLLTTAGINRIITMDLHADQIQGYFNVPVDHLTALPLFARYFANKGIKDAVVVAPDTGRAKMAKKFSDKIGAQLAILHKSRPEHNVADIMHVVGDVKDKTVILFDDMVDTGGSVTQGLKVLREHGANPEIYLATTHPVFSGPAIERLTNANFKEVVTTNTIPIPKEKQFPGLKIISAAPLLAEAISRNFSNKSISELFEA
ncbi:MAG: ribose-phosphate pyrophosphokinase [Candidatus Margulisiibacteriota bacterium]|nr:MAG: ribose-phosphate pyrophosphokinase [Candidatus Margulisbacteria bacterium GWD2_39_127]OGI03778.1 MAG: ribose-phosphate pyrophosphokinase [Candidatus Margulisbacteria bacterium GWF2_38_17]OGI05834.1 MAG: ribose-phosphate pyrophosphokinase [Candidatus Margulisbacteria bacterium GWE2_39_32]PZM82328.1 MAG: ribose-phosphate pyrophosphokinase [Candidatus Margulisiibacteriota bacterium]HAR64110.1 ribose-phosphate pyrophosphokinase [Candidatus Margulisiibacteriota bacterium]